MIAVLAWVGRVVLAVLALVLLLLLVPVGVLVDYTPQAVGLRLQLLFFRLDLTSLLSRKKNAPAAEVPPKKASPPQEQRSEKSKAASAPSVADRKKQQQIGKLIRKLPELLQTAGWFLRTLLRVIYFRNVSFFIPICGEDAAQTAQGVGKAYAVTAALAAALRPMLHLRWGKTVFYPDYRQEHTGQLQVSGGVYGQLFALLLVLIALLFRLEKENILPQRLRKR